MDEVEGEYFCNICHNDFDEPVVIFKNCRHYSCPNCSRTISKMVLQNDIVNKPSMCHTCRAETGSWLMSSTTFIHGSSDKNRFVSSKLDSNPLMARNGLLLEYLIRLDGLEVECRVALWSYEQFYAESREKVVEFLAELPSLVNEVDRGPYQQYATDLLDTINYNNTTTESSLNRLIKRIVHETIKFRALYALPIEYMNIRTAGYLCDKYLAEMKNIVKAVEYSALSEFNSTRSDVQFCIDVKEVISILAR